MHILTIGDPNGYAFRVTMGRLSRRGRWHGWQPCVFFIWKGKRGYGLWRAGVRS